MSKVSVIMPVYNAEKYLKDSIESILNQTFSDFEFLIVDDCSNDRSKEIIKEYAKKDKRIVFIENKENLGITKNLNKMISLSKTDIIVRMDADDISYKDRLEKQYEYLINNNVDILFSHANLIDDNDEIICKIYTPPIRKSLKVIEKINYFIHPTAMIRKEVFEKYGLYNEKYKHGQDWELWKRVYKNVKIDILEKVLLGYRLNLRSITLSRFGKSNNDYYYESAKACLRNFDLRKYNKFLNKISLKQFFLLEIARLCKYYKIRKFLHEL